MISYSYFAAPDDFTGVSNTLLLFDWSTRRVSVTIFISDNKVVETAEIFQASLTLVDPLNPNIITVRPSMANISIEDDDSKSAHSIHIMGYNNNYNESHKSINVFLSLTLFLTVVVIGFEMEKYTTFEPEGVITLFVSVIEGNVVSPITISLSTINSSASGKCTV